jgi:uncharacterized protein
VVSAGKRSDVQQYLSAGGSPNVIVEVKFGPLTVLTVPLLCSLVLSPNHREAADSIGLLLQAGAAADATFINDVQVESTALICAAHRPVALGGLTVLQSLLDGGADPCYQTQDCGTTALHAAAAAGYLQQCMLLAAAVTSAGRTLELRLSSTGDTPLLTACALQRSDVVKQLCSLGANVNSSNYSGNTVLMIAARHGDVSLLQYLLQQDGININQTDNLGDTALKAAAASGHAAAVTLLIEHGADTEIENSLEQSAIFAAGSHEHLHIVKLLLQLGVDITARSGDEEVTLLMRMCAIGRDHIAEFLIQQGLSVHEGKLQWTALHYAAYTGTPNTVRLLLEHGAVLHALAADNTTPLQLAVMTGRLQNAEALLAAGADASLRNDQGSTALHSAIASMQTALVKLLLEHGAAADINSMQLQLCKCSEPISALMYCKDTASLKLLLTAGADVQAVTSRGNTCLHVAAQHGYTAPVVCLLIKAGADLHAVNREGKTAA